MALASAGHILAQPASSSTIVLDASRGKVFVANADANSVSTLDAATHRKLAETAVGKNPRTLALQARHGLLFTANFADASLSVVALSNLAVIATIPVAQEPYGVVCSPAEDRAFAACSGPGVIAVLDTAARRVLGEIPVAPRPRGLAVSADGQRLYVTHFFSGETSVVDLAGRKVLARIPSVPGGNMAQFILLNSSGTRAYVPHIRSNTSAPRQVFDSMIFPVVSTLDLGANENLRRELIGLDAVDRPVNLPFAAALTPDGKRLCIVNSGSDDLSVIDLANHTAVAHLAVGANPRGIVIMPDGRTAFVANHVSGDVSVIDLAAARVMETVPVTTDARPAAEKRGQRLFFTSALPEVTRDHWVSCASCHFDEGTDGRTWNTVRGPRNTQSLLSIHETAPLHWSADRVSVQDFQRTLQGEMGGRGLAPSQLDDLAAFVNSLRLPPNPNAKPDGPLAARAKRGESVFTSSRTQCATCHAPPLYTDRKLHDVGTGDGQAERFGPQFDTPSLRGLFATAPYLHDGTAATVLEVLTTKNPGDRHGVTSHLTAAELNDLEAFLLTR